MKIGFFESGADLLYMDEVHGPLITMADKVVDIIFTKYFREYITYEGIQRVEHFPVPRAALREALLNAIVHRDYSTGVPVQVKVFPGEVMICSTGGLPERWTVENLLGRHGSMPRNPGLANVFFRFGQIETWGRGIEKIEEACRREGKPSPTFDVKPGDVTITFAFLIGRGSDTQELSTTHGDGNVVDIGTDGTEVGTDLAGLLIRAMSEDNTITYDELATTLSIPRRTVSREVKRMRDTGVIRRVGSARRGHWEINKRESR